MVLNPPPSVGRLMTTRAFCSPVCVRAFLLETLAEMEGLGPSSPKTEQSVNDLRETYLDLFRTFEELRFDLTSPRGHSSFSGRA